MTDSVLLQLQEANPVREEANPADDAIWDALRSERRARPARRPLRLIAVAIGVPISLAAVSIGVAELRSNAPDPLVDREQGRLMAPQMDARRLTLRVSDSDGQAWAASVYRTRDDLIARTVTAAGIDKRLETVSGDAPFGIAFSLRVDRVPRAAVRVVRSAGRLHYVVAGIVDARARSVSLLADGHVFRAALSRDALSAPVKPPDSRDLVPGAHMPKLPRQVRLRAFAVALTERQWPKGEGRWKVELPGATRFQRAPLHCDAACRTLKRELLRIARGQQRR